MSNPLNREMLEAAGFSHASDKWAADRGIPLNNGLLCCATRGRIPVTLGSAATTHSVCAETRRRYHSGGAPLSEMRLVFANFYIDQLAAATPTGQELSPGNSYAIEAAIEIPGAPNVVVRATFGGASTGTVPNGAAEYVSDPLYPSQFGLTTFAPGTLFWVRERRLIAIGEKFTRYGSLANAISGEGTKMSNGASASQVMGTGEMVMPSGGSSLHCCFAPSLIIGRAIGLPDIAIVGVGDSIVNGSNDPIFGGAGDGTDGHGGWFTAGLWDVEGRAVPHCLMAGNGTTVIAATEAPGFATAFAKRRVYLKYFTHAVDNYGTNDYGKSPPESAANTLLRRRKLWAALRGGDSRIRHVTAVPILPRCNSTDSFATLANQTARSGYESGGQFRDPMNSGLEAALTDKSVDAIFPINSILADPSAPGKWRVDGTANRYTDDGTHPTFYAHGLVANAWKAMVSEF